VVLRDKTKLDLGVSDLANATESERVNSTTSNAIRRNIPFERVGERLFVQEHVRVLELLVEPAYGQGISEA
jgi:hypothetical protein